MELSFFGQPALFERLCVGSVVYVPLEKAQIRPRARFNRARLPFAVTLGPETAIREASPSVAARLPVHGWDFVTISSLAEVAAETRVDVLGVVIELSPPLPYTSKQGAAGVKRIVTVGDITERSVDVTCFLKPGDTFNVASGTVLALRGTVGRFRSTPTLTCFSDGLAIGPAISEANVLAKAWHNLVASHLDSSFTSWRPTPLAPSWQIVSLDELPRLAVGSRVDVAGVVCAIEVCTRAGGRSAQGIMQLLPFPPLPHLHPSRSCLPPALSAAHRCVHTQVRWGAGQQVRLRSD